MPLRITTWNVNGIRNPFNYEPFRHHRGSYSFLLNHLESDIVILQELKIQRKDMTDDMVHIPGWDCFFSLPVHKKGYSGVAIYTRNETCAPIRAEEGLMGVLSPPGSETAYRHQAPENQIGGYLDLQQLEDLVTAPLVLDSEGRCVLVEFPAFVVIGLYCPANSNGQNDDFRMDYLVALDWRVRNLVEAGKRVIVSGDLNVVQTQLDFAKTVPREDFLASPHRRLFNHLVEGGRIAGVREPDRKTTPLVDVCRTFHPGRAGLYTHWDQKLNARSSNYGSRIDYILGTQDIKSWFIASDIRAELYGSDHCAVYAVLSSLVTDSATDEQRFLLDLMNPPGVYVDGKQARKLAKSDFLPLSATRWPEFDLSKRQNIRDMFSKRSSSNSLSEPLVQPIQPIESTLASRNGATADADNGSSASQILREETADAAHALTKRPRQSTPDPKENFSSLSSFETNGIPPSPMYTSPAASDTKSSTSPSEQQSRASKKSKTSQNGMSKFLSNKPTKAASAAATSASAAGQQKLKSYFVAKSSQEVPSGGANSQTPKASTHHQETTVIDEQPNADMFARLASSQSPGKLDPGAGEAHDDGVEAYRGTSSPGRAFAPQRRPRREGSPSKRQEQMEQTWAETSSATGMTWGQIFSKRALPRCHHHEACKLLTVKKPGYNCGRQYFVCGRPLGPNGKEEVNTEWRCPTFRWSSEWYGKSGPRDESTPSVAA